MDDRREGDRNLQRQIDDLRKLVATNRGHLEALMAGADAAERRADGAEVRSDANHLRIDELESRADADRKLIAALEADGLLNRQLTDQMYEALRSSRKIGAAIGIVMAVRRVSEDDAFALMIEASQNTNRKIRDLAIDVVETGDTSNLPPRETQ